jgi:hypothetical protein
MNKPKCQTLLPWLRANLGKKCLAPLTSQDAKALAAAVQIIDLYGWCDRTCEASVFQAFGNIVRCMQRSTQELAYHAIAHVLDWHDRERIWKAAGLDPLDGRRLCAWEPGGSERGGRPVS